jgi:hypothetical protein
MSTINIVVWSHFWETLGHLGLSSINNFLFVNCLSTSQWEKTYTRDDKRSCLVPIWRFDSLYMWSENIVLVFSTFDVQKGLQFLAYSMDNNFLSINFPMRINLHARWQKVVLGPNLRLFASLMSTINIAVWSHLWETLGHLGLSSINNFWFVNCPKTSQWEKT